MLLLILAPQVVFIVSISYFPLLVPSSDSTEYNKSGGGGEDNFVSHIFEKEMEGGE